jgi:hypothetical protein
MEAPVEIRYAGVVIGRAQEVRGADGDSPSFFLVVREPMPVGSVLHLRAGDRETPARVVRTVESPDATACGMQVRLIGEGDQVATEWIPPPAVVAEKARSVEEPAKTAMPVIEVGPAGPAYPGTPTSAEPPTQSTAEPQEAPPAAAAEAAPTVSSETPVATAESSVQEAEASDPPAAAAEGVTPVAAPDADKPAAEPAVTPELAAEPSAPAASGETAAIPEAVPVAVGSSMTGALENAAEGLPASSEASQAEGAASSESGAFAEAQPSSEELPPARPIAGPSGRRKTKRRR